MFVSDLHAVIGNGKNNVPFTDKYDVTGASVGEADGGFRARPVVGGEWAGLAILDSDIA